MFVSFSLGTCPSNTQADVSVYVCSPSPITLQLATGSFIPGAL